MKQISTNYGLVYNIDGSLCATLRETETPFNGVKSIQIEKGTINLLFSQGWGTAGNKITDMSDLPEQPPVAPVIASHVPSGDWKDIFSYPDSFTLAAGETLALSGWVYVKGEYGRFNFNATVNGSNIGIGNTHNINSTTFYKGWNYIWTILENDTGSDMTVSSIRLENYNVANWPNSDNEAWGCNFQLEQKSFPTSFVWSANTGLDFDGTNDYVDLGNIPLNTSFTVEVLVNPDSTNDSQCFFGKNNSAGGNICLLGYWNGGYHFVINEKYFTTGTKASGTWDLISAVAKDNGDGTTNVELFKNGISIGSSTLTRILADSIGTTQLGMEYDGTSKSDYFNGKIKEQRVWNKALTQDEIISNMKRSLGGAEPGLVAYYDFKEGIGSILNDKNEKYNGTIYGATWLAGRPDGKVTYNVVVPNDFVLAFWRKNNNPVSIAQHDVALADQAFGTTNYKFASFSYPTLNRQRFSITNDGTLVANETIQSSAEFSDWHFIVFTYIDEEIQVYINGEPMLDSKISVTLDTTKLSYMPVGYRPSDGNPDNQLNGFISNLYFGKAKDKNGDIIWTDDFIRKIYETKQPFV